MSDLSATLLAGGKSTRMGFDKCLLEIDDMPLWRRQCNLLISIADDVKVAAPIRSAWCPQELEWVQDEGVDCGPLGGLLAALAAARHERVLALAVDMPGMNVAYLRTLAARATPARGIVPTMDGRFQPLSAIYPRQAAGAAREHLREPDKSLQHLVQRLVGEGFMEPIPVSDGDRPLFQNLNSPADLPGDATGAPPPPHQAKA